MAQFRSSDGWRPFAQPVTYLGVAMLACIYAASIYLMFQDRDNAVAEARRHGDNLVRLFEESVIRALKNADDTMLLLRASYGRDPAAIERAVGSPERDLGNQPTFEFSIAGPDGRIVTSSFGGAVIGLDISQRAHFRAHVDSTDDRLFVGEPLILQSTGGPAVFLSRRLSKPDGSFNGIMAVSFDLTGLENYCRALNLGDDGVVALINRRGVVLTRVVGGEARPGSIGARYPAAGVIAALAGSDQGSYWNGPGGDAVDQVQRLISYRAVDGFPLIALVGMAEPEILRHANENARIYWSIDLAFTAAIMIAVGFGAARERKLLTAAAAIEHQAHHDALTDLANRVLLGRHIEQAIVRMRRRGEPFNLLMFDLDHFKAINDTLGHAVGDLLVKAVAKRLTACVREGDIVGRIGGDEFAVLQFVEGDPHAAARTLAERLLVTIGEPFNLDGHQVIVETSIGIALAPADGEVAAHLLKNADLALYRAKADGRNTFRFFEASMGTEARGRYDLEIDLRQAVTRDAFEVAYQPVVDAALCKVVGVEALMRWRHPERGNVAPDSFVPLAESTGLIVPLGAWILRTACREAAAWPAHLKVAVNLSPIQFRKGDIVGVVADALTRSGLSPERLELEITESVLLQKDDLNITKLYQLKSLGVAIVLDDFGIGYSSLSYLRNFPFDKLKIDRSFVAEVSTRPDCAAIVCAITGLARSLNMLTTAEGVETIEQLELLRAAGCDLAQGYLFGKPCAAASLNLDGVAVPGAAAA